MLTVRLYEVVSKTEHASHPKEDHSLADRLKRDENGERKDDSQTHLLAVRNIALCNQL